MIQEVLHGDCLELMKELPDECVDLIITDPPYGMNYLSGWRKEKHLSIDGDDNLEWLPSFCKESFRILKPNSHAYIYISFHRIDAFKQELEKYFDVKNILVWVKNNHGSGDLKGNYASKTEFIFYCMKGRKLLNNGRHHNVLEYKKTLNNLHPTEKPVDMFEFLIAKSSNERDLILDVFAGSGTTGIACMNTNRQFILMEKEEKYYNTILKRIEDHKLKYESKTV